MSATKFNGFEKYFIQTALKHAIEQAELDVLAAESDGKRSIYAAGYLSTFSELGVRHHQGNSAPKKSRKMAQFEDLN